MAFTLYYTANFKNELEQDVAVSIYKKDGAVPDSVENYVVTQFELNDSSEGQTKYECIIVRELTLGLLTDNSLSVDWQTFISSAHDDWFLSATVDGQLYFEGYITPDEGTSIFQDKPYEVIFKATNGLALLKDVALLDVTGAKFVDENSLIKYIAGALKQTGLSFPIRIYCGYFNVSMLNKGNSLNDDMFQQTFLNYRAFQSDAVTFVSCYDALKIILDKFCRLEYWKGYWQITNIAELQYIPGDRFYVDYDSNGENPVGAVDTNNYAQVGKNVDLFPCNENQVINSRFAVKSVQTLFNYIVWPELPKNNKFERGAVDVPHSGSGFTAHHIDDWAYGGLPSVSSLPGLLSTSDVAFRKSSFDIYGVETIREILLNKTDTVTKFLQSEGIPVNSNDVIQLDFNYKLSYSFGAALTISTMSVYIIDSLTGLKWSWQNRGTLNRWIQNSGAILSIDAVYIDSSDDTAVYKNISVVAPPLPVSGNMYVVFGNASDDNLPNIAYYSNFNFTYKPFVAGGFEQVKGDRWFRSQNKLFLDVIEDEVKMSDSLSKIFQGAMIFKNLSVDDLTHPTWYRIHTAASPNPGSEAIHFKELLNIARYNHSYRRFWAIEGDFCGLNYAPQNNQLSKQPIGFHWMYRFVDLPEERDFALVPPLKMNLITGVITATFVEVRKDADGVADGTQTADLANFNYVFT